MRTASSAPRAPLLLPLLALLAACGLDAPQQYLVPDLRVVAVRSVAGTTLGADVDLDVDTTVTLEALVVNPLGRSWTLSWYACAPEPGGTPCEDPDVLRDPSSLPGTPGVIALGTGSPIVLDLAPYATALQLARAQLLQAAAELPRLACQLYLEFPVLAVAGDGEETAVALKRVRIAPTADLPPTLAGGYVLNGNPSILAPLQADPTQEDDDCTGGTPVGASLPAGSVALCARPGALARDTYNECSDTGARTPVEEDLAWQWYVTGGEIAEAGFEGNATSNPVDFTPPTGGYTVWTLVRDGRGGTGWIETPLTTP